MRNGMIRQVTWRIVRRSISDTVLASLIVSSSWLAGKAEQACGRVGEHGAAGLRVWYPGFELGPRPGRGRFGFELGVRPIAAPDQVLRPEGGQQRCRRGGGDVGADPVGCRKLHPNAPGRAGLEQV